MTYQYGDTGKFPYGKRQRMREGRVWQVRPAASLQPPYCGDHPEMVTTLDPPSYFNLPDVATTHMWRPP